MTNTPDESTIDGKLVAVEGLDGSGKSTQVYLLKRWLELDGYKVFFTEWNSSATVRKATRKGKKRQLLTPTTDRKSTRLNSSHGYISYAVFCLKKKKKEGMDEHAKETDH